MGRKRAIYDRILRGSAILLSTYACTAEGQFGKDATGQPDGDLMAEITVCICTGDYSSKAYAPDEQKISDLNLLVFDGYGFLEECRWYTGEEITENTVYCDLTLIKGQKYRFCACANIGREIYASTIDELMEEKFYLTYPDEYREGMPMSVNKEVIIGDEESVTVRLEYLMAKISISMDRSRLSEDVEMNVTGVRIGNCPKVTSIFGSNRVSDNDECFVRGFSRSDLETGPLNSPGAYGTSDEVVLYMLENMQGQFSAEGPEYDADKVFDDGDFRSTICSYVEVSLEYLSPSKYSSSDDLIYRFYLGEGLNDLNVERNCHYHIIISPEDDGLQGDGWRVDKSGIMDFVQPSLTAYPASYIRGDIGDRIHIWCDVSPATAPFDVGESYMADDKAEGLYDYEIDEDGHGAILTLTGPGRGLIYMEAGEPVNDAALFIIEINLPEN